MPSARHTRRRPWLGWCGLSALYVALTLVYAWPLLGVLNRALPNDAGDPALLTWILWWNSQALPFTDTWWNAPAFFPASGAFAYSETLLAFTPLTTPLHWAGLSPIAVYNIAFLVSFPACALAAHALARHLTGRHDAALLAGLAFGFSQYRAGQFPHMQLLWAMWMPLALLGLHRHLETARARYLVGAGVCWMLNGLTCGYYLVYFALLVAFWMFWFLRSRAEWFRVSAMLAIASIPLVPLLAGYHRLLGAIGGSNRSRGEIEGFSADLTALWAASRTAWLSKHWTFAPNPEGELYPGAVVVALVAIGIVGAWRLLPRPFRPEPNKGVFVTGLVALSAASLVWVTGGAGGTVFGVPVSVTRPHRLVGIGILLVVIALLFDRRIRNSWRRRSMFGFYVAAAVVMFAFAIGPVGRAFGARFMDKAPYFWLMQFPGGDSLRVPARFAMLFILCMSQAAVLAFSRLGPNVARWPVAALLATLVLADGWVMPFPTVPVRTELDLRTLDRSAAVLELPMRDLYDDTAAMLHGTSHGRPVVNGYSGFSPPHYGALQTGIQAGDPTVFAALRHVTPLIVVVNRANDTDGRSETLVRSVTDAKLEFDSTLGPVYTMGRLAEAPPRPGSRVPIASVEATDNPADARAMIDGDVESRWATAKPQKPGPEVHLVLERNAELGRIEMDLGGNGRERTYPRLLRVSVASGDEQPRVVWEGGMAGEAVLGAIRDRNRTTIAIVLPSSTAGQRLTLTLLGNDPEEVWSIAELRVFGAPAAESR